MIVVVAVKKWNVIRHSQIITIQAGPELVREKVICSLEYFIFSN